MYVTGRYCFRRELKEVKEKAVIQTHRHIFVGFSVWIDTCFVSFLPVLDHLHRNFRLQVKILHWHLEIMFIVASFA